MLLLCVNTKLHEACVTPYPVANLDEAHNLV